MMAHSNDKSCEWEHSVAETSDTELQALRAHTLEATLGRRTTTLSDTASSNSATPNNDYAFAELTQMSNYSHCAAHATVESPCAQHNVAANALETEASTL